VILETPAKASFIMNACGFIFSPPAGRASVETVKGRGRKIRAHLTTQDKWEAEGQRWRGRHRLGPGWCQREQRAEETGLSIMMQRIDEDGEHQKGLDCHVRHAGAEGDGERENEDDHCFADSGHRM